jgi:hypothetical protein
MTAEPLISLSQVANKITQTLHLKSFLLIQKFQIFQKHPISIKEVQNTILSFATTSFPVFSLDYSIVFDAEYFFSGFIFGLGILLSSHQMEKILNKVFGYSDSFDNLNQLKERQQQCPDRNKEKSLKYFIDLVTFFPTNSDQ